MRMFRSDRKATKKKTLIKDGFTPMTIEHMNRKVYEELVVTDEKRQKLLKKFETGKFKDISERRMCLEDLVKMKNQFYSDFEMLVVPSVLHGMKRTREGKMSLDFRNSTSKSARRALQTSVESRNIIGQLQESEEVSIPTILSKNKMTSAVSSTIIYLFPELSKDTAISLSKTLYGQGLTNYINERTGVVSKDNEKTVVGVPREDHEEAENMSYRRSSHLEQWLSTVQGLDNPNISPENLVKIKEALELEGLDLAMPNKKRIREILKRIGMSRYYENIPYILVNISNGRYSPVRFGHELESKIREMFHLIQNPFHKYSKIVCPGRRNFLSYSYSITKFLQILGRSDLMHHFALLKSREKLSIQDQIFKLICADENIQWPFFPSI